MVCVCVCVCVCDQTTEILYAISKISIMHVTGVWVSMSWTAVSTGRYTPCRSLCKRRHSLTALGTGSAPQGPHNPRQPMRGARRHACELGVNSIRYQNRAWQNLSLIPCRCFLYPFLYFCICLAHDLNNHTFPPSTSTSLILLGPISHLRDEIIGILRAG